MGQQRTENIKKTGNLLSIKKSFLVFEDLLSFYLPGIIIVGLMVLMCLEIFIRFFLNSSILGVVEIVEFSVIVILFTGLAGTQREKGHVRMNLLIEHVSIGKVGILLEIINLFIIAGLCAVLSYPFIVMVLRFRKVNELSFYLSIPYWLIGLVMPAGLVFLIIRVIIQGIGEGKGIFNKFKS